LSWNLAQAADLELTSTNHSGDHHHLSPSELTRLTELVDGFNSRFAWLAECRRQAGRNHCQVGVGQPRGGVCDATAPSTQSTARFHDSNALSQLFSSSVCGV